MSKQSKLSVLNSSFQTHWNGQTIPEMKENISYFENEFNSTLDTNDKNEFELLGRELNELLEKLEGLNLSEEDYNLWVQLKDSENSLQRNDTVKYGCDCGCGGDSLDWYYEEDYDAQLTKDIEEIEKVLSELIEVK